MKVSFYLNENKASGDFTYGWWVWCNVSSISHKTNAVSSQGCLAQPEK